jgi:hypothetical protein
MAYNGGETDLLHPALAVLLEARGDAWFYEVTLGGTRNRIDFLVHGETCHVLMECKMELSPKQDIAQINGYYKLYNDPTARKMVVTPNKIYKHAVTRQYTEQNIAIMYLDGKFRLDTWADVSFASVRDLYPHRCHYHFDLSRERVEEIRASYDRRVDSVQDVATRNGLSYKDAAQIIRGYYSPRPYLFPQVTPSDEVSI